MGYKVTNTTFDESDDELEIGLKVKIINSNLEGVVIMKIANLYQVELTTGEIKSYTRGELDEFDK